MRAFGEQLAGDAHWLEEVRGATSSHVKVTLYRTMEKCHGKGFAKVRRRKEVRTVYDTPDDPSEDKASGTTKVSKKKVAGKTPVTLGDAVAKSQSSSDPAKRIGPGHEAKP